jgi:hypothetical protein
VRRQERLDFVPRRIVAGVVGYPDDWIALLKAAMAVTVSG